MADCWSCGAERGDATFCSCGRIQAPSPKKNYFQILGMAPAMKLSRPDLDIAFRTQSKQVHPDRFSQESTVERKLALQHTERLNHGYRTLKEPLSRAQYLLELAGVSLEAQQKQPQNPEFLMQMMELQEQVESTKDEEGLEELLQSSKQRYNQLLGQLSGFFDQQEGTLNETQEAVTELRYYRRLLDNIEFRLEDI